MTQNIQQALLTQFGDDLINVDSDSLAAHTTDWSGTQGLLPVAVARPRSTKDVQGIVRFCHERGITIVPQGGLTGLVGAATVTCEETVVIALDRMNKIEDINAQAATVQAEAGVILENLQQAVAKEKMLLGVDFGARGSCQIGGVVVTNAGGHNVLQYGIMREQVLGLEVVLPDGTLLPMLRPMLKNNTGYDLKQLFIGSEGTLGIVTKVLLRLHPTPKATTTALLALPTYDAALKILNNLQAQFPSSVAAFELMWSDFWEWSLKHQNLKSPFSDKFPFYALIELHGSEATTLENQLEEALAQAFENELILDATIAQTEAQAIALWRIREASTEIYAVMPLPINFDISIPVQHIDDFVKSCEIELKKYWSAPLTICFGHIGDSNLHLTIDGATVNNEEVKAEQIIYDVVGQYKGSISAEHGVGLHKKPYLNVSRTPEELALMQIIKQAIDPLNKMNPGKVF